MSEDQAGFQAGGFPLQGGLLFISVGEQGTVLPSVHRRLSVFFIDLFIFGSFLLPGGRFIRLQKGIQIQIETFRGAVFLYETIYAAGGEVTDKKHKYKQKNNDKKLHVTFTRFFFLSFKIACFILRLRYGIGR